MTKKTRQYRAPIKRPTGKQKPLAIDVFAEKAAHKQNEAEKQLNALETKIVAGKAKSNQDHFSFATGIIAGGGIANFIALQIDSPTTLPAKALMSIVIGGLVLGLNKNFFFTNGVFKEMLKTTNSLSEDNNDGKVVEVPSFKKLRDQATEKRTNRKDFKSTASQNTANVAVILITSLALANLGYKVYEETKPELEVPKEEQVPVTEVIREDQENNMVSPSPTLPQP